MSSRPMISIAERMNAARVAIANSLADPEIQALAKVSRAIFKDDKARLMVFGLTGSECPADHIGVDRGGLGAL